MTATRFVPRHRAPAVPPSGGLPPGRRAARGAWTAVLLLLGAALLAAAGGGRLVELGLPLVVVVLAARLLRRSPEQYLELVLWCWLLIPMVRRVVDLHTGYSSLSPVMLVPPLVSCLCLVPVLMRCRELAPAGRAFFAVALPVLGYGLAVGVLRNGPAPALAALLNWLPAVALGLWLAGSGPTTAQVREVLRRVALWGTLLLGGYALVQFFVLPAWDAFWMANAELSSIGRPFPLEVRVFSTLNSPGPYATVAGALLLVVIGGRDRLKLPVLAVGALGFTLSLVRGAWAAFALTLLLLARRGQLGLGRLLLVLLLPPLLLVAVGGPVQDVVLDRVERSAQSGTGDESLGARLSFYAETLPVVLREPVGAGLGSVGTATKLSNTQGRLTDTGNFDSGVLEFVFVLGLPAGGLLLGLLLLAVGSAWRRSRHLDTFDQACAAASVGIVLQLVFVNVMTSVTGVFCLVLVGHLLRQEPEAAQLSGIGPPARPARAAVRRSGAR